MKKFIVGVLAGAVCGIAATWVYLGRTTPTASVELSTIVRDIGKVPPMAEVEGAAHRAQRFESMQTVEETLRLRSDFDQTEALYVIAGRSDSAQVQDLIYQTLRVADASDRRGGLSILFSRLADIDPQSAVAMAGQAPFTAERSVELAIWRTWARSDLERALLAASRLSPASRKNSAAEAIYGAHGNLGNDVTRHIEQVLGIPPSRRIKSQYVLSLAADSPESAFDYLNQLQPLNDKNDAAWVLGAHFGRDSPARAESYASLIVNKSVRSTYQRHAAEAIAKSNPTMVLDRWLDEPDARNHMAALSSAIAQLANTDLEAAIRYAHAAENQQITMLLSNEITKVLAREDPVRALQWAQENGRGRNQALYQQAIMLVAATHPEVAMEAINEIPGGSERDSLTSVVVASLAKSDPARAVATLEQMPVGPGKQQAAQYMLMTWAQVDAQAAMLWAVENTEEYGAQLLSQMASQFISRSPDAAIQVLPQLDERTASDWSVTIVQVLASQQSAAVAEAFMNRYKDSPQYARMQAALIPSLAQTDLARARQMADAMAHGPDQDRVYLQLIGMAAAENPRQAAAWVESMPSESGRGRAVSTLVKTWVQTDRSGASRWVNNLPAGNWRDDALIALINSSRNFDDSQLQIIERIDNEEKKSQATMSYLFRLARTDRSRAESLLDNMALSREQRTQLEQMLAQATRGLSIE